MGTVWLPHAPALVAGFREVAWLSPEGEIEALSAAEAVRRIESEPPILCHAAATMRRLGAPDLAALDILELFAFVHPVRFCVPTPRGVAEALGLPAPQRPTEACLSLVTATRALLEALIAEPDPDIRAVAEAMARGGWLWAQAVLAALPPADAAARRSAAGMRAWLRLPDWSETAPAPPPSNEPVTAAEARARLARLLGSGAEPRPQQFDYAAAITPAFAPRDAPDCPKAVLAEAGTGVGKTLGYIAAASLWAEKNRGSVWISTFTEIYRPRFSPSLTASIPTRRTSAAGSWCAKAERT